MSNPAYRPWTYVRPGSSFGKPGAAWAWPAQGREDEQRGAVTQHLLCQALVESLRTAGVTRKALVDRHPGLSYDTLTKVLRGELLLRMEHAGAFAELRPQLPSGEQWDQAMQAAEAVRPAQPAPAAPTPPAGALPGNVRDALAELLRRMHDQARRERGWGAVDPTVEIELSAGEPGAEPAVDGFAGDKVSVLRGTWNDVGPGTEIKVQPRSGERAEITLTAGSGKSRAYLLMLTHPQEPDGDWEYKLIKTGDVGPDEGS